MTMRTHYCGELRPEHVGQHISVCGWVARRREHGEHLAFVDLRDHTGVVQCVVDGAHDIRSEQVLRIRGTVRERPEGTANAQLATGGVEVGDCTVEILSPAEPPPFPVEDETQADEAVRLRYRYVDIRRPRMQRNLRLRATVTGAVRRSMERQGFTEVETPLLWTPTPEGAREFTVPSRLQQGSFYVLPQSPQIAKQLLMVAGFDRYYQIAKCMRDEDLRADRQFEFTQLDLEASFVEQEDVFGFVADAVIEATEAVKGEPPPPIERVTWAEAMDRFGTDKPDLRFGMELVELTKVFGASEFRAFQAPYVGGIRVAGEGQSTRSRLDSLVERAQGLGAKGLVWMRVVDAGGRTGVESPVAKFLSADEIDGLVGATAATPGDLLLLVADERRPAQQVLGQLRNDLGRPPVGEGPYRYLWVVDFPLFEAVDADGRPVPAHHPFTMPHADDLEILESDPLAVRSQSYDLVVNGWELGSGSIRIHRRDIQQRIFAMLGLTEEEAEARFGFLLGAFRYGAPPHGGFGMGMDRLVAVLAGEENIREIIAFPKTQSGADLMTGAPKPVDERLLRELGIRILPPAR
ncbi:MAG TPA: aspartate--tRNA ligase [Acidimicrobiales bacterium]|nr:aspartate--tRNA ligase [Acidimicrobiales bacterium]